MVTVFVFRFNGRNIDPCVWSCRLQIVPQCWSFQSQENQPDAAGAPSTAAPAFVPFWTSDGIMQAVVRRLSRLTATKLAARGGEHTAL